MADVASAYGTSTAVSESGRDHPAQSRPLFGRAGSLALRLFLNTWLAVVLTVGVIAVPSYLVTDVVFQETNARLASSRLSEQRRAAETAAHIVSQRVDGLRTELVAIADSRFTRQAMAQGDAATLAVIVSEFRPVVGSDQAILTVFVEDTRGVLLALDPHDPTVIGRDFSQRDYFIGVTRGWEPFVSEAFRGAIQGNPSTTVVAVPVFAPDGKPAGVLGASFDLSRAVGWFEPFAGYQDVYLVDRKGRLITHARDALGDSLKDLSSDATVASAVAGLRPLGPAADPLSGRSALVASAPVGVTGWQVIIVDDPTEHQAALSPLMQTILAIRVLLLLVVAALTVVLSRAVRGLVAQRAQLADSEKAARTAEKAAEAANKHKSEFLANMSHELRTPLNAILGFTDLLQEQLSTTLNDRQKRYLRNVRDAGDHLLALINDVLDLSKVEAGRIELRPETLTVDALLAPVLAATREAARAQDVDFAVTAPGERTLYVDAGRVRQILYNLLSNAVKFTPGGGRVSLTMATSGQDLEVAVADTGLGIPEAAQHRVFATFERLHEGRSQAGGTGLGLALTKRLIELHGGTITFTSREAVGTTFTVHLPNVVVDTTTRRRVLVVEDERRDADLVSALAAKHGLPTEVVASIEDAAAAVARGLPSGVVLDLRLRDGRGEDLLARLKGDAATSTVPVIVVTVEDDEGRSRGLGADDHLTKPIDHARLELWLERVAVRQRTGDAGRAAAPR